MNGSIILGLLQNIAILLAFTMLYDLTWVKQEMPNKLWRKVLTGVIIGGIGVILMLSPWTLVPGLVFDTRSILLSISGIFFGSVPTIVAMAITGSVRMIMGGDGTWMGLAVIASSGTIGIVWRNIRPAWKEKKPFLEILGMGFMVHLVMLLCTFLLPRDLIGQTLRAIALPIVILYPFGTALLGQLMAIQHNNWVNRKAKAHLAESERRFSELMRTITLFSVFLDIKGNITFCNQYFLETTGYREEELLGRNWMEVFIDPADREEISSVFRQVVFGNHIISRNENEIILKDGTKLTVSWNNAALFSESGEIIGGASIGENVTQRREFEKTLMEAKERAVESDRLKSIFLTNMSHEIRTPMNAIMGFSRLLGSDDLDLLTRESYINIINNSSNRLLRIIDDIIDISKIEAKQLSIHMTDTNIHNLLRNSIETFEKSELLAGKPGITISFNVPDEFEKLTVETDPNRLQQVIDNLISNAIKYTKTGTVTAGVEINPDDDADSVRFYVTDTGPGIPESMRSMVFERFRQVEENRYHEGAGLGLSISKGIVELLGGRIWYSSEETGGSTFYFTLPLKPGKKSWQRIESFSPDTSSLNGRTFIIAEDEYESYLLLRAYLSEKDVRLLYARDGEALMEMLETERADLLLLDINMPRKSGIECLEEIREKGIDIKVIVQTAYAMSDEKEQCMKAGCHGYISKPILKPDLLALISQVLE